MTVRTIDEIYRDFVTDGVPASGPFNPYKPDIRDTLKALTEGSQNFPDNRVIRLNNANAGTANNIVVTASVAIPAAAYQVLYILNVTQENTGPVKVSGAINRDLVTNTSRPIEPGYLKPGMALLCIDTGTQLRLLSYGNAEAILAAAEAAADRAEAAAEAAEAAAGGALSNFDTRSLVAATNIPPLVNYVRTAGFATIGDGGAALYKRVASPALGSNIIQNGDFASDTGWIKGTGWAIASGKASKTVTAAQSEIGQAATLVAGEIYAVTFTIADYSGSGWVRPYFGYSGVTMGSERTANGTYTDYIVPVAGAGRVVIQAQATVACSIDNVSVRKVADAFQSADGAWWELSREIINGTTIGGQFDDEPYLGIIGGAHFGDATANDDPRGYSHGFFRRTGDTTLEYGNNLRVMTMIESAISHVENAGYFGIIQSTASTGTDSDIVATVSTAVKSASALGSDTSLWGANPLVIDQTNRKSSVSGANAFLRGLETNVSAGGPDDNNRRIGHDVIMFHLMGYPDSIDGATSHYCGQRVTTSAGINSSLGDVTVKYAYISDPSPTPTSTKGHIEVGYLAQDSSIVGFLAKGAAPAGGAFRAEITGGGAEIYLVSDQKTDGSIVAGETYVGLNSANGGVIYGQIRQQIGSSATGSEQGYWYLSQMLNGVKTDVLAAIGSGPNPIFMYVNGALRQVTVGAADSGGAGYRVLRVNN